MEDIYYIIRMGILENPLFIIEEKKKIYPVFIIQEENYIEVMSMSKEKFYQ